MTTARLLATALAASFATFAAAQESVDLSDLIIHRAPEERPPVATGTKRALIVGVGEATYNGVKQNPLPTCRFDAAAIARVLQGAGFETTVLVDGGDPDKAPSADKFAMAFDGFLAGAGPEDTLLVYMSSHGGMIDGEAKVILTDGAASVPKVKSSLGESRALVRVLMLDCCRSEGASFRPDVSETRDVHTISACAPDQISQVGVNGLSLFTEAFVDGMTDCTADRTQDGVVELDEIVSYVASEVPKRSKEQRNADQRPTRTVVDARSINPVLSVCDLSLARIPRRTTALGGPKAVLARKDWILTSLMLPKASVGMSADQVRQNLTGKDSLLPALDAQGNGAMMFDDEPKAGDALLVRFEMGKVVEVSTSVGGMCDSPYSAKASREAALAIIEGGTIEKLTPALEGKSIAEVVGVLGCPAASLVGSDAVGNGSLRYVDVPRVTQMLVVNIEHGRVVGTEVRVLER
ncbi:MAG: caspase family protein [Phycisphaerales bacterium]